MWKLDQARLDDDTIRWTLVAGADRALGFGQVAHAWATDSAFRRFWIDGLRQVPFDAYCWECPPIDAANRTRPFECVFVSSPSLGEMPADAESFAGQFRRGREIVKFANLGGDALLIAPCPEEAGGDFSHLASFTRTASPGVQQALWGAVGQALEARIGDRPIWLSTAGHGVAWLHVRLDSAPKYYRHDRYRKA